MKKRFSVFFIMFLMGLGISIWGHPISVAAKTTMVSNTKLDASSSNIRNYTATGSNALYNRPGALKSARQVASGSTLASYKSDEGQGLLRAYRVAKLSNGSYYMKVVTFDDAYRGWIYVGKTNPTADYTKVAGGLINTATTRDSDLTDQEKTDTYIFKQVGTVDDGTMLTYKAPMWTQYRLGAQITDSTPYANDKLTVTKAATRTREGDRWVYVDDAEHPEVSGWILDSALEMLGQVTVNYQDELGQMLHDNTILNGPVGTQYEVSPLSIVGYQYVRMSDRSASKMSRYEETPLVIDFIYQQIAGTLTVNYVDEDGNLISSSQTKTGLVNDKYDYAPKAIAGYTYMGLSNESVPESGVLTTDAQTLTFVYTKKNPVAGNVTVNFTDESGEKIAASKVITGKFGDDYKTEKVTIPGYTYVSVTGITSGKLGSENVSVTYHYKKNAAVTGNVTANYVDENGKQIATPKVLTGNLGDTYETEKLSIPGYTYVSVEGAQSGKISSERTVVTYHYKKVVVPTETPTETPTKPETETPTKTPTSTETTTETVTANSRVVVKGQAIYAIRKVGLYRNAQFSRQNRVKYYQKAKRINRPEFVVKGYKKDKSGHLRYRVQQYNPYTKRYIKGTTGYLTASSKYVVPVYYATKPRNSKIRVINPSGIYEYRHYSLTGQRGKLIKVGATFKVTQIQRYKYTTRYRMTNGKFVTANKKFVIVEP